MVDEAVSLLRRARARIEDPVCWTQGCSARSAKGREVLARSMEAMSWCAIGAMQAEQLDVDVYFDGLAALRSQVNTSMQLFNDSHSHAEVLAVFDAAIESLRVREDNKMTPKKNDYFLDDALDWLRAHITDAPEDAIARALYQALDNDDDPEHLELRLDALIQREANSIREESGH